MGNLCVHTELVSLDYYDRCDGTFQHSFSLGIKLEVLVQLVHEHCFEK